MSSGLQRFIFSTVCKRRIPIHEKLIFKWVGPTILENVEMNYCLTCISLSGCGLSGCGHLE